MAKPVGRPRKQSPRRKGATAREEILDAASELFTRKGFATTSTHEIADAVGIRQASLYYHFPSKRDIFLTLLMGTIEPALDLASELAGSDESPALKLWALVAAESRILLSSNWNIGRLYQLPVLVSEEFAEYHEARSKLEGLFRDLASEIVGDDDPRIELPFHMTLSAIEMRDNTGTAPYPLVDDALPAPSVTIADAVLDVLHAELPDNRGMRTLDLVNGVRD
ncbi:TetR/AcrR family transcriptional regulator [Corynebacterium sp. Marseille-P4321]|uniref:TetR/AcrR family transcriptional regulator n=1 Tax=Corynebacterium sp. Marseille-P4321 TaxID=2736603 RepID=UPI000893BCBF|nr:TetR/AcrR family transcriptional regulator [Corynebacterium sp. Marseille-P4321]OEY25814.1 TetR family transcriptional regulator [Corynebacterium sp. BCW_4722]